MKTTKCTQVREFDPQRVKPFAGQPRKRFRGIPELAKSIAAVGQIIPGKVILLKGDPQFDAQLLDGERRLRACQAAGVNFRAEVQENAGSDAQQFETSLAANFGKQDHDCVEIAIALGRLRDAGRTVAQMADICGKSVCWVTQHLSLLKLHPKILEMLIPSDFPEDEDEKEAPRPLGFTTAVMLSGHPQDFQQKMVRKVLGLSFAEARRVLLAQAQKDGVRYGERRRSPLEQFLSLQKCIEQMTHKIGVYVDMKHADMSALIAAGDAESRKELLIYINELNDELSGIADTVENSLPKRKAS